MKQRVMVGHTRCTTAKGSRTGSGGSRVLHQLGPVPARWTRSSALPPPTPLGVIAEGFLVITIKRSAQGSRQVTDGDCDYQCADQTTDQHVRRPGLDPVGLEYAIVAVTCSFSQQGVAVRRRSGTRA